MYKKCSYCYIIIIKYSVYGRIVSYILNDIMILNILTLKFNILLSISIYFLFQYYTVVRNVKKAHQIQEIGEFQEINDDIEYLLDALQVSI